MHFCHDAIDNNFVKHILKSLCFYFPDAIGKNNNILDTKEAGYSINLQ